MTQPDEHEHEQEHDHEHEHEHGHEEDGEHHHHAMSYEDEVLDFREQKDEFFRSSHASPIPHEIRHDFTGLRYFAPDEAYRIEGVALEADPDPANTTEIVTSDGKTRTAGRVGTLSFSTPNGSAQLAGYAFGEREDGELFVPFRDGTSGKESYGAGRYLDLEQDDDGTYAIDFNLAYNPWCAYAPQYSCPLPPPENWLPFRVEAGEQNPDLEADLGLSQK